MAAEINAAGTRVKERDLWMVFLLTFLTSGIYRVWWYYATNRDLTRFGRARSWGGAAYFASSPKRSIWALVLAWPGIALLWLTVFPWGAAGVAAASHEHFIPGGWRWALAVLGLALAVPAVVSILRTGWRVRRARELAGLPPDRIGNGPLLWLMVAADVVGLPVWMFWLQSQLNALWVRYPRLYDEDLFGELAPAGVRARAIGRRPQLHARRRARRPRRVVEDPRIRPRVVVSMALVCTAVFAWQVSRFGFVFTSEHELEAVGGLRRGLDHQALRWVASNFLHASVAHIAGNMLVWVAVGVKLERAVGHLRLLALVAVGAVTSSFGEMLYQPNVVGVGFSGVIFAAVGMAVLMDLRARTPLGKLGWALVVVCVPASFAPGIGTGAHLGGLAGGAALGLVVRLVWRVRRDPLEIAAAERAALPPIDHSAPLAPPLPRDAAAAAA